MRRRRRRRMAGQGDVPPEMRAAWEEELARLRAMTPRERRAEYRRATEGQLIDSGDGPRPLRHAEVAAARARDYRAMLARGGLEAERERQLRQALAELEEDFGPDAGR